MTGIADFFGDPLVWPAIVYLLAYTFVWLIALVLGQFLKNRLNIERAAKIAWRIAFFIHIIGGTFLIIWLWDRAHNRFADGLYSLLYLLLYIVIMIADVYLVFSILSENGKKTKTDSQTPKTTGRSRNPKKS